MKNASSIFDLFSQYGIAIDPKYRASIEERLNGILNYQPSVGVFGKTGVGKSSLCNAMFGQDACKVSDVAACTREPQEVILSMGTQGIKLLDVPGVGENAERDKEYAALYKSLLPELDIVLWVVKGDDRAYESDERFYKNIVKPYIQKGRPFFMVINQVDKIEPFREWDVDKRRPGANQSSNIDEKRRNVAETFGLPLTKVIPVSAGERFGLVELVDSIVHELPKEKKAIVLNETQQENRSHKAKEEAKDGFWDTVVDVITDIIPVGPVVKSVISAGKSIIGKLFSWW
ncbi:GTPase family protein [Castellaniella defragrans]|uniref:GTPase family protein n=1 Tax=Castellaniella defragrans TaxID=75697 RepID=UPI002AFDE0E2|nr:GTPase [Castellaniella defragrans]